MINDSFNQLFIFRSTESILTNENELWSATRVAFVVGCLQLFSFVGGEGRQFMPLILLVSFIWTSNQVLSHMHTQRCKYKHTHNQKKKKICNHFCLNNHSVQITGKDQVCNTGRTKTGPLEVSSHALLACRLFYVTLIQICSKRVVKFFF